MTESSDTCIGGTLVEHPQLSRYVRKIWNVTGIKIMKVKIKTEQYLLLTTNNIKTDTRNPSATTNIINLVNTC